MIKEDEEKTCLNNYEYRKKVFLNLYLVFLCKNEIFDIDQGIHKVKI